MGSTNVYRVLGVKWGIIVQILDILKGLIPTTVLVFIFYDSNLGLNIIQLKILSGLASVLGHIFSPFVGFKGGKGINTAVGMMIGISYIDLLSCLFFFLIALFTSGMISVGALAGSVILPISLILRNYTIGKVEGFHSLLLFFIFLTVIVFYTHRSNIKRLMKGNENKFEKLHLIKLSK